MPVYKSPERTSDGRQWFFQVSQKTANGYRKHKSKKYGTKKEAEVAEAAFLLSYGKSAPERLTFSQIAEEYLVDRKAVLKPSSWLRTRVLSEHVCAILGDVCISTMRKSEYDNFRATAPM